MTQATQIIPAGYKQTEIGAIPVDWDMDSLGNFVTIRSGESPSKFKILKSGVPYFKVDQLNNSIKFQKETPYYIEVANPIKANSLIFPKRGAAIYQDKIRILAQDSYMDTNLMTLTVDSKLDNEYLFYYLLKRGLSHIADTTSVPQINNKHIIPFKIIFPKSKPEQTAIGTFLSDADTLLEKLEKLIAKKRAIKEGAMQQLLTGKKRLPGFSGKWEVKKLGEVGKCLRGVSYKGDEDLFEFDSANTMRLLRSNNIKRAVVNILDIQFVNSIRVSSSQIMKIDDILICMANGSKDLVGKAGMFKIFDGFVYTFGAFMGCFRMSEEKVSREFVFNLFQSKDYRDYINNMLAGSSINNLTPTSIESMAFSFPEYVEQVAIATFLSDMDTEIRKLENKLRKYHQIKTGMMQQLLTGKIRLVKNQL